MEITDIKNRLTLAAVLHHYGLKPDKNMRLLCPFHEDKNPSLQVYYKTHTAYCFSTNCRTHGRSLDVIDFILYKEGWDKEGSEGKHKAIELARELAGITGETTTEVKESSFDKAGFLGGMFTYFRNAVHNSKPAKEYINQRGLDYMALGIGYNTGQFHHGARKDQTLIDNCIKTGLLLEHDRLSRTGDVSYKPFGKFCIVFALRNRAGLVTGLYFRSTVNNDKSKHYYLKDRRGLYPGYPQAGKGKLILTESVIDAASLLMVKEITARYTVLSCYGTNGLTKEHTTVLGEWAAAGQGEEHQREIIFAFDNDEAGNKAVEKYTAELAELLPGVTLSRLELPCKDVNETFIAHLPEVFTDLLENRIFLSNEPASVEKKTTQEPLAAETTGEESKSVLQTKNPYKISYTTDTAVYYIQGGVSKILDSMKVTLVVEHPVTQTKSRNKVDLYEDKQVEKLCKEVSERLALRKDLLQADLYRLTDLLDDYREKELANSKTSIGDESEKIYPLSIQQRHYVEEFLRKPGLVSELGKLLGKTGIAGEQVNRIFLLVIATSYKMPEPLHALIQGSSGSGKTRLLRQISDCMPAEKVIRLTRVSDKGFYNYPENYLRNKLLSLEDIDGLGEEATFALRELQSNGELNSATSVKLENGQIISSQKRVRGPVASLACTTRGEIYEDNMSRVFLIAVDESAGQTQRIIQYQNDRAAGLVDTDREKQIKYFIQNVVREIKAREVLNPYANRIQLPRQAHKIRRLNELFQSFIKMITVINQYQRKTDDKGRLISETADIESAIEIMFESIVLKVDELDGSLRQFYEKLKKYVEEKGRDYEFSRFEVRETTGMGKTQQHHYINKLLELEYIRQYGFANRGFKYKIVYWDDYHGLREQIKNHLLSQLHALAFTGGRTPERTPEVALTEEKS